MAPDSHKSQIEGKYFLWPFKCRYGLKNMSFFQVTFCSSPLNSKILSSRKTCPNQSEAEVKIHLEEQLRRLPGDRIKLN
jgi:hypothetical protein